MARRPLKKTITASKSSTTSKPLPVGTQVVFIDSALLVGNPCLREGRVHAICRPKEENWFYNVDGAHLVEPARCLRDIPLNRAALLEALSDIVESQADALERLVYAARQLAADHLSEAAKIRQLVTKGGRRGQTA